MVQARTCQSFFWYETDFIMHGWRFYKLCHTLSTNPSFGITRKKIFCGTRLWGFARDCLLQQPRLPIGQALKCCTYVSADKPLPKLNKKWMFWTIWENWKSPSTAKDIALSSASVMLMYVYMCTYISAKMVTIDQTDALTVQDVSNGLFMMFYHSAQTSLHEKA